MITLVVVGLYLHRVSPVHAVPAGAKILMFLGSANNDPRHWTDPRRFDLELMEVDRNRAFIGARYRVVGPRLPPD